MGKDRRQLILDAASRAFTEFGYKATTMDLVAKMANVGKGTIYTFFKNKEELFDEIFSSLFKEMRIMADEVMETEMPFHEKVHQALFAILEYRKSHLLTIKVFQESAQLGTPEVKEVIDRIESMIILYIKTKIEQAIEDGEIENCHSELLAFTMYKLYIALIFDWEKKHDPLEKETIANLLQLFIEKKLTAK
ncbi:MULTISPECIES: TetR/AcrR family transcriptional regulator [Bacillus]|uniref:TetR family transcriptional regulator n=2 Tax=Bacillus TaxID=1386 RepID=A0A0M4FRZ1_9BACI|nr:MULTISPECIES: TetR/AcrR family transcriptional regulator [Bacillus]ALC80630.1 TetR family transcriptional regulator [Bacillus gobiensis]MBP1079513.1 AcrR family transcriptional regulator [Bacillus capparidis]MED1094914.1 TetR/AcrR family transcriptional regulator [Bacillus capparidis]